MRFVLLSIILFVALQLWSQERGVRCVSHEYFEHQSQQNPELLSIHDSLEKQIQSYIKIHAHESAAKEVIVIPVVVHVLYKISAQNISNAQIFSQIDVLNEDFRRLNSDTNQTPTLFKSVAADCQIEFCLAKQDPQGNYTSGITRTQTTKSEFNYFNDDAKFSSMGGHDIWDRNKYLNIWVVPSITNGVYNDILGYAQFPGGSAATDGVVISWRNFGRIGNLDPYYNLGRTATHEVGHWLNLYHIWGDDGNDCWGTDYVNDTPNQADESSGCPNFPAPSCNNTSDMFSNYLDYSDDACMNIFTEGQKLRMLATLNGARASIKSSPGCLVNSTQELTYRFDIRIFPNPSKGISTIKFAENFTGEISIYASTGQLLQQLNCFNCKQQEIKLSRSGLYFVHIKHEKFTEIKKIQILP